jgi:hypothetical protein
MKLIFIFTCLLLLGCKQVPKEPALLEHAEDNSFEKEITINAVNSFVNSQAIVQEIQNDDLKGTLKKQIKKSNPFPSVFGSKLIDNLSQAIESSDMKISKEEIDFINSIEESDNPVIQIATLKKF